MLFHLSNYAIPVSDLSLLMETMGQRIKRLREARGLTQQQLATLVGVTKGAVSQWEGGGVDNIRLVNLLKLLTALSTDTAYLVYGPDRVPRNESVALFRDIRRAKQ